MKKAILPVILIIVVAVCAVFLQPIQLVSDTSYRYSVHVGKEVKLQAVGEVSGGYRCYVNDDEYIFLGAKDCVAQSTDKNYKYIQYRLKGLPILYR